MALTAMVVVAFSELDEAQRELFDAHMDSQDWLKVPKVTNAWAGNFPNAGPELGERLAQMAVDVVTQAARHAKLKRFDAAVHLGPGIPSLFSGP